MSNEIEKNSDKPLSKKDFTVGDRYICDRGCIYKIGKILKGEVELVDAEPDEDGHFSHYGTIPFDEMNCSYLKIEKPIEEIRKEAFEYLQNSDKFREEMNDESEVSESREVSTRNDKKTLMNMKNSVEASRNKVKIYERLLKAQMNNLRSIKNQYEDKMTKISKVIDLIELYIGVHETVLQIGEGDLAHPDEPITFRQQVLFMDEELGDPRKGGLDFQNIEDFDTWVCKKENLDKVIPESKAIVAIRPRRYDKDYGMHPFVNAMMNQENRKTYFLIRNGHNLYRVWSNIEVSDKLFPGQNEFKDLRENEGDWGVEKLQEKYRKTTLIFQGLFDRTQILKPHPEGLNLSNPKTWNGKIRFIYDDEFLLPTGHESYKVWHEKQNAKLKVGSRVYFCGAPRYDDGWHGRYPSRLPYSLSYMPDSGIYTIVRTEQSEYSGEYLVCQYKPEDTIYRKRDWRGNYDDSPRKTSVPFKLLRSDSYVLNYDQINLEDVEFYLESRVDRGYYLDIIPVLWDLRVARLEELKWEQGFVDNLKLRLKMDDEKLIWDAIEWWKLKVIWKRPLTAEDAKALRMITAKVRRALEAQKEKSNEK